jgi:hypothetical protein
LYLIWKYANYGLDISNEISIREEIELVKYISLINYSDDDFQKKRKEIIAKGVHAWNKLLLQLDPDWNPNERIPRGPRTNSPGFLMI